MEENRDVEEVEEIEDNERSSKSENDFIESESYSKEQKRMMTPMSLDLAEDFGKNKRSSIAFIVTIIVVTVIVAVTLSLFKVSNIIGDSMFPNLKDGDMAFISRVMGKIEHGDIVVFERTDTDGKTKNIIKRVIGIPGDTVEILEDGVVKLNGEILEEDYLEYPIIYNANQCNITLKDDEYFVLGDNRDISYDSEDYGPINKKQLYGKLLFVF